MKLEQIFYFHAEEIIKGDTIGADDKGMFGLKEFTVVFYTPYCSNLNYKMFKSMLQNVQISSAKIRIISETQKKMAGNFIEYCNLWD